jgi:UDP-N-acetyl-2-amino-2-deoxyglucuronate dehydrogenase
MAAELGFALIGCGKIAEKHLHVLTHLPGGRLVSCFDNRPERAIARAQKAGGGVLAARALEEALAAPGVDVVSVCTPSGSHASLAIAAARAGKHVIVEKPIALTLDEADRVIDACDAAGVKLFVVKQNRYNRPVQALRRALDAGRLGRLFMGGSRVLWHRDQRYYDSEPWRGTWAQDGGVITNQASHHVDLLIWLMGDVVSVFATGTRVLHEIETEDTATVLLRFRHGAAATVQATTCTQPRDLEGSIALFGTRGTVEIGGFAANELRTWMFDEERPEDLTVREEWGRNPDAFAYNHMEFYKDVLQTIASNRRALIDGIEGRRSLEVIHAIYESMESGHEVTLRFEPRIRRLGVGASSEEKPR